MALVASTCAGSARAQLLVVATPGEPPAVAHAELAYAVGAGTPVTWLSLRVQRGPVAVVAALPAGALVETGLDAWFSALEDTASPNVALPRGETNCADTENFAHVTWPRSGGSLPTELSVQTAEDAVAALDAQGLSLEGALPQAPRYAIWWWPAADAERTTRTLRVVGTALPITSRPGSPFPLLVSSVTRGAVALPTELFNRELSVTFVAQWRPASDYVARLRDWLGSRSEPLLEARARGLLFDWSIYEDTVSSSSLVSSYATRAAEELPDLDAKTCGDQLHALREPGAPSAAACGDATDVSLALAAAGSEMTTLQRFVVSGLDGFAPADATEGGLPSAPVIRAELTDESACKLFYQPSPALPSGRDRGSSPPASTGTTTIVVEETLIVDDGNAEVSCGAAPPEPDDSDYGDSSDSTCSADSSDSSDDSGCASDSGSASDGSETDCASDSASSSRDDNGCGSDSSSSTESSDTSCDGGGSESSSYDGDTCTGAAAPGAERTQQTSAGLSTRPGVTRPRRLKTSLWSMAFVAFVLPIRRRKRDRSRRG